MCHDKISKNCCSYRQFSVFVCLLLLIVIFSNFINSGEMNLPLAPILSSFNGLGGKNRKTFLNHGYFIRVTPSIHGVISESSISIRYTANKTIKPMRPKKANEAKKANKTFRSKNRVMDIRTYEPTFFGTYLQKQLYRVVKQATERNEAK